MESTATFIQGIFGVGGESWGDLIMVASSPDEILKPEQITPDVKDKIIVAGSLITFDTFQAAKKHGARGIISAGLNDSDLRKLLNISILNRSGRKISRISILSDIEIVTEVSSLSITNELADADINSLVVAALELQEDQFERVLNSCLIKFGFERTFCHVIFPLFEKLGIMWQIGRLSACQDRFITNLIRQKLLVAIDGLGVAEEDNKGTFILFMPAGHDREIELLFASYLIRKNGYQVLYLGSSVPFEHLEKLEFPQNFSHLFVALSLSVSHTELQNYISQLRKVFPNQLIHLVQSNGKIPPVQDKNCFPYCGFESFSNYFSS